MSSSQPKKCGSQHLGGPKPKHPGQRRAGAPEADETARCTDEQQCDSIDTNCCDRCSLCSWSQLTCKNLAEADRLLDQIEAVLFGEAGSNGPECGGNTPNSLEACLAHCSGEAHCLASRLQRVLDRIGDCG